MRSKHARAWAFSAAALLVLATSGAARAQGTLTPAGVTPASGEGFPAPQLDYQTPRSLGMGLGGRASAASTTALVYNPANLGLQRVYHVETGFGYIAGENTFGLETAIADSVTNQLAVGASFVNLFGNGTHDYDGWDMRLAAGMPLTDQIAIGVGFHYLKVRGYSEFVPDQRVRENVKAFTIDASARVTLSEMVHIAVMAYNLVDTHSSLAPTQIGASASLVPVPGLDISVDFLSDLNTYRYTTYLLGVGAEYLAGQKVPIRAGYRNDFGRGAQAMTMSLGYVDARVSVELALTQWFDLYKESDLLFTFRYHVQ